MYKYGIVAIGYKNALGVQRLLKALDEADYQDQEILLIVSIDYSGKDTVLNVAKNFEWKYGQKVVRSFSKNLGLRKHVLACGDYLNEFDLDALIVFEDDMYPSIDFFRYSKAATEYFINDDRIAGISLYNRCINQTVMENFYPLTCKGDNYFLQYAQSRGQIWFRKQWNAFIEWYDSNDNKFVEQPDIPSDVANWYDTSWLKYHIKYCVENNKFFVYPYISYSTCFGEEGVHLKSKTDLWQVPLSKGENIDFDFVDLDENAIIYDAFFENRNLYKFVGLNANDLEVDLFAGRTLLNKKYILTTRKLPYKIIRTWGNRLVPHELNIIRNIQGNDIFLYERNDDDSIIALPLSECREDKYQSYFSILAKWLKLEAQGYSLEKFFLQNNWLSISIYGLGDLGWYLYEKLKDTKVTIKYVLDKNVNQDNWSIANLYTSNDLPEVDICIITSYWYMPQITNYLIDRNVKNYVSIKEIINQIWIQSIEEDSI